MADADNNLIRQLVRDVFNKHQLNSFDEMFCHDFVYSSEFITAIKNRSWLKGMLAQVFTAFPDFSVVVESFGSQENIISLKLKFSGTLKNDFMGISAAGQYFSGPGVVVFEMSNNKIKRIQAKLETHDFLHQLKSAE